MVIENHFDVRCNQEKVWNLLMDTEKLAGLFPGCEEVKDLGEGVYQAVASVQIAFMKLKFHLNVKVTDMNPPNRLVSEVDGKPLSLVGQLKMKTVMNLYALSESVTKIQYQLDMSLTGKLGALGQSAFRSKATEMGNEFAENIRKALEAA